MADGRKMDGHSLSPGTLLHGLGKTIAIKVPRSVSGQKGLKSVHDPGTKNLGWDIFEGRDLRKLADPSSMLGTLILFFSIFFTVKLDLKDRQNSTPGTESM